MYKILCPVCRSSHAMKNGKRSGVQLYICHDCNHQFRNFRKISEAELWELYMLNKQTIRELASHYGVSESTIKRILKRITKTWVQPELSGTGFVNIDATYWGRNSGIILAIDNQSGRPLYLAFINHEKVSDYVDAIRSIKSRGYVVNGIVLDGIKSLFREFAGYKLQMCQFHMRQIVRRYLTLKPRLKAARELKDLVDSITRLSGDDFRKRYADWKLRWKDTLNRRSVMKTTGRLFYTHKRLRTVSNSIDYYLPYLFTFEEAGCEGMPNTNNKIEGTFTDLKNNLNNHSGMSESSRKRFISGFFLALLNTLSMNKK